MKEYFIMTKNFDEVQKKFYTSAEEKRFYWQTENDYIKNKELELFSGIKELIKPEDKILEVGCGEGANIKHFRSIGVDNNIVGIDFLKEKIDFCSEHKINDTEFYVADARKLPFEDNSFEITFMRDILHHLDDDRKTVINELRRVTKPGGYIIIIEANYGKFTNKVFAFIYAHERGIKNSTINKLKELVNDYDYEIKAFEPSNFFRFMLHYSIGMPYISKYKIVCKLLDSQYDLFKMVFTGTKLGLLAYNNYYNLKYIINPLIKR